MLKSNCLLTLSSIFIVPFTLIRGVPIYSELEAEPNPFSLDYLLNEINQTDLQPSEASFNIVQEATNSSDLTKGKKPSGLPFGLPFIKPKPNFVLPLILPTIPVKPMSTWSKAEFESICKSPDPYLMSGDVTNQPANLIASAIRCYINSLMIYLVYG